MRRISNNKTTTAPDVLKRGISMLTLSILLSFSAGGSATENDNEFERAFLRKDKNSATPDIFLYKNAISPGMKRVEMIINDRLIDVYDVNFVENQQKKIIVSCLNRCLLQDAGVKTELYDNWQSSLKDTENSA